MGCGHSKINGYFRKSKSHQTNNDYSPVSVEKYENEDKSVEESIETTENSDENSLSKAAKLKPYGGVLLAQAEISTSQQDFFRLLDEKIENGPDYDSESESEKIEREARLLSLLENWQISSRSLNNTPSHYSKSRIINQHQKQGSDGTENIIKSSQIRCTNLYMNSINNPYNIQQQPSPTTYISDYNQNQNQNYQTVSSFSASNMQYRTVTYPQQVHHNTFRHEQPHVPYQPQYSNSSRCCTKQQPKQQQQQQQQQQINNERTVRFNNYYNMPNETTNTTNNKGNSGSSSSSSGMHESRIEMNPLHRKQYELT